MKSHKPNNQQKQRSFFEQVKTRRKRLANIQLVLGLAWIILVIVNIFIEADLFVPVILCAIAFLMINTMLLAEDRGFHDGLKCASEIYKKAIEKELKDH